MESTQIKVTQYNNKFVIETTEGKLHILNERALKWNLTHVFCVDPDLIMGIMIMLYDDTMPNRSIMVPIGA